MVCREMYVVCKEITHMDEIGVFHINPACFLVSNFLMSRHTC